MSITGLGTYVPDRVLTNDELSELVDTSDEWIMERTGIKVDQAALQAIGTVTASDISLLATACRTSVVTWTRPLDMTSAISATMPSSTTGV